MKVHGLQIENYKRLRVVDLTPEGAIVRIGGKNGQGKSSILDAIYVALKGRAANPPQPVRAGEERATIRLDLGELVVTRTFTVKEGKPYTDSLKVENAEGFRASNPQATLDALLGEIGFDPFEWMRDKPKDQVATVMGMVPLSVDLDELSDADTADRLRRRDVNRDRDAKAAQLAAIEPEDVPTDAPDRDALTAQLAAASETNTAIERERSAREARQVQIDTAITNRDAKKDEAAELRARADAIDKAVAEATAKIDAAVTELAGRDPLAEAVDPSALQAQLREADTVLAAIERQKRRNALVAEVDSLTAQSQALTDALIAREKTRTDALAKAPMPVEGLGIAIDDKGAPFLTWDGLPFDKDQISTAVQLRVSTAIGMAANPELRVLRIKDGSLLDDDSMAMLAEMAETEDFQLWVEVVGDGGTGIIMEDGAVRVEQPQQQAEGPSAADAPADAVEPAQPNPTKSKKASAKKAPTEGGLL